MTFLRRRKAPTGPQIFMDIRMPAGADPHAIAQELAFSMGGLVSRLEPEDAMTATPIEIVCKGGAVIGSIVHYSTEVPGHPCRAAIVADVGEVQVNEINPMGDGIFREALALCVLDSDGMSFKRRVLYVPIEDSRSAGNWHWPCETS